MRKAQIVLAVVVCTFLSQRLAFAQATQRLQALIDKAEAGAEVTVPKGTWKEPVKIDKALKLRGEDRDACVIDVVSDSPAIDLAHANGEVVLENLTVRWKLATSERSPNVQAAIAAKDGAVRLKNVRVVAADNFARCPSALVAYGFADVKVGGCEFEGYEFTIQFGGGAKGAVADSIVANSGHCGITAGENSTVEVARTIVTGSRYHGIRCTGGELNVHDNLIIANKNRGVYLGNKPAAGTIKNNAIKENGSGISAFGDSEVKIHNNLIQGNDFSGVDMRDTCRLDIEKNLLVNNGRAVALFKEAGTNSNSIGANASAGNKTEAQGFDAPPAELRKVQGQVPTGGEFAMTEAKGFGLSDPNVIKPVWERWTQRREKTSASAADASPAKAN